jgi:hypothetical protein
MVYGRYNYSIHGGFVMVYKPTYNWGAHPVNVQLPGFRLNMDQESLRSRDSFGIWKQVV